MLSFGRLHLYTGCGFLGLLLVFLLIAVTQGFLHPLSLVLPLLLLLSIIGYLGSMLRRLALLVGRDPLTGIANRWFLESFIDLPKHQQSYFSLILLDLDNFKDCNDVNGHQHGDAVLQEVAGIIRRNIRSQDVAARLGGDEFVILLPGTSSQHAYQVAERIRKQIADESGAKGPRLTASIGVTGLQARGEDWYPLLLTRADRALYQAKKQKNRVMVYPPGCAVNL